MKKYRSPRQVGGPEAVTWLGTLATLGRSAFQLGVLERGLQMTAEYAREREQFDRPIGSFQAVSQRLADGYIDVKGLRLTLTQAAWKVSEDIPADIDVASAAFWAADAGHRVAHTVVHVHGGFMVGTTYHLKSFFDVGERDLFWCTSDIGWIVGHSYIVYAPLCAGATTLFREGAVD